MAQIDSGDAGGNDRDGGKRRGAQRKPDSLRSPLPPQLRPVLEPFPDLALEAAVGRIVEGLTSQRFREIVLAREGVRRVVVVLVATSVAFRFHQLGRRIQDVLWRQQRTA